jgi:ribosomal RNA assembly protein
LSFEKTVKIPIERVGVLIGKGGSTKKMLEKTYEAELQIDSKNGDVIIRSKSIKDATFLKIMNVVEAIGRGFSPNRALRLEDPNMVIDVIDLREYSGKSENALERIRGRIIGLHGKSRRVIEELTGCYFSIYGRTVAIIGEANEIKFAKEAVHMLASGSTHRSVYNVLQRARTKKKMDRIILWEDQSPERNLIK